MVVPNTVAGRNIFPSVKDLDFQDANADPLSLRDVLMPESFIVVAIVTSHCDANVVSAFLFAVSCPSSPYQHFVYPPELYATIIHCST